MIDTTGKCSACGQTVGIDTIHTCSPQVSAPKIVRRVGEAVNETDAGNHDEPMTVKEAAEWAKNSRALRNFGDERAFQRCCQTIRVREEALARLTAEVERLRGIATDAVGWLDSRYHSGRVDAQARFRAALSLPTPAPEADQ